MQEEALLRLKKLNMIAQQDEIYQMWHRCYLAEKNAFEKYADAQPEAVRSTLYGYAECGRLVYQRLSNLACMHMDFIEPTKTGAD